MELKFTQILREELTSQDIQFTIKKGEPTSREMMMYT